jgi:hypothetical protein
MTGAAVMRVWSGSPLVRLGGIVTYRTLSTVDVCALKTTRNIVLCVALMTFLGGAVDASVDESISFAQVGSAQADVVVSCSYIEPNGRRFVLRP